MTQPLQYLYQDEWIPESSTHQFPPFTLYDETGAVLTNPSTLVLTLFDLTLATHALIGTAQQNIKTSTRGWSAGVLALTLVPADTILLVDTRPYELRNALIEWTFGSGATKSGCQEIIFVVKNVLRRPFVA